MCDTKKSRGLQSNAGPFTVKKKEEDSHTPFPLGKIRVRCWIIEVSAEHGFCTRMEVIREDQR